MNYGDGWYGGVYVGAMYSLAFVSSDINYIVSNATKTIPVKSEFYQCINDVIQWHKKYPADWKQTWLGVQKKWANDIGCPDGVFVPFNIDAKVNAAYVVMGLLYGNGDFTKTLEIATRCGQDADCNPSSAGGILGTILGYEKIPGYWKMGLKEAEDINFKYTTMSLNNVYEIGVKHALQNILANGGKVTGDKILIKAQLPKAVKFEKSFDGLYPVAKSAITFNEDKTAINFEFTGTGFAASGATAAWGSNTDAVTNADVYIDGQLTETAALPLSFTTRRHELCWNYNLTRGQHKVNIQFKQPIKNEITPLHVIVYDNKPGAGIKANSMASAE